MERRPDHGKTLLSQVTGNATHTSVIGPLTKNGAYSKASKTFALNFIPLARYATRNHPTSQHNRRAVQRLFVS